MSLPALVSQLVDVKLKRFCEERVPLHVREDIRLFHTVRGNSVTIVESRPTFSNRAEWSEMKVAQLRYCPDTREWTLYCADRNSRWHPYYDIDSSTNLDDLLLEVDEDPTGIFWG